MYNVELTDEFDSWLNNLEDSKAQKIVVKRIRKISLGTFGDVRSLKKGLFEAKIHYGPGYRLYFVNKDKRVIIMLCGGEKSEQKEDIKIARKMAEEI